LNARRKVVAGAACTVEFPAMWAFAARHVAGAAGPRRTDMGVRARGIDRVARGWRAGCVIEKTGRANSPAPGKTASVPAGPETRKIGA